jgi:ankyrin repeat protein
MDEYGRTPLWYHAANGDAAGLRAELAGGADPSFGDDVNYSPLHAAVQGGRVEAIQLLLEAGADPSKADTHGNGPLWTAVLSAPKEVRVEIITLLLAAGANPDHKNRYGLSPREAAKDHGVDLPFASRAVEQAEPGAAPDNGRS